MSHRRLPYFAFAVGLATLSSSPLAGQTPVGSAPAATASPAPNPANPFSLTPAQLEERRRLAELAAVDHQRMMDLLGLPKPGPFPPPEDDPKRPANTTRVPGNQYNWTDGQPGRVIVRSGWGNWSNYDLTQADIGPLPKVLVAKDGEPIKDAYAWWTKRRPEILADFETEIYGKIPANTPEVTWEVAETDPKALDGTATMKRIVGHIDNSRYPAATPSIQVTLYIPENATGPVPVMVLYGGGFRPGPPAALPQILAQGCAVFNPGALQADSGGGLNVGIIGLVNKGKPRQPDDWGSLAALSWGLSRAIDYFETDPAVDAKRLGLQGHSRWGKATLVAAAYEPRWAIAFSSCSGECGAKLHRHNIGQTPDNVCGVSEYHWMAGNFLKYADNWEKLPVDQHQLVALIAPRPVFITGGNGGSLVRPGRRIQSVRRGWSRLPAARRKGCRHDRNARAGSGVDLWRNWLSESYRRSHRRARLADLPKVCGEVFR